MKKGRSFWKWLYLWARAGVIEEERRKRDIREYQEEWHRENRAFIRQCEREDARMYSGTSADESSAVGYFGSDCGDGGDCSDGSAI